MTGRSCCIHNAAISHRVAVAICATSLCAVFDNPCTRLLSKNSHGSRGTSKSRILCAHALMLSQIGSTFGQDHSMWTRSAVSPHCFGQSGE
ncbi:hypothetical protein FKM82_028840 [Ascaphus truei]